MSLPFSPRISGPYTLSADQTGPLDYGWRVLDAADITVLRLRAGLVSTLALTTDYTVTGVGAEVDRSVWLTSGAQAGDQYLVIGDRLPAREGAFSDQRGTTPILLNHDLDAVWIKLQEHERALQRALIRDFWADHYDAGGRRIMDLGEAQAPGDALPLGQFEGLIADDLAAIADNRAASEAARDTAVAAADTSTAASLVSVEARDAALAAAANADGGMTIVSSRSYLRDLAYAEHAHAYLTEPGREGTWLWRFGDFTTQVATDSAEGIWLASDHVDASIGAWVRQFSGVPEARWWGVVPGAGDVGAAHDVALASVALAPVKMLAYDGGTYTMLRDVDWSALDGVVLTGDVVFDFSSVTSASNFPLPNYLTITGPSLVPIPALASDVDKGDARITFASAPAVSKGDRIVIYNPTDYSWSGHRNYYRAGEMCRIGSVSGATVDLMGGLYAGYAAADVDCYLLPRKTFRISGGGKLLLRESPHATMNSKWGCTVTRICDSDLSAISSIDSGWGAMVFKQCAGLYGVGYDLQHDRHTSGGVYYGLVISNCQDINVAGSFRAGRHAVTLGGGAEVGDIPNRNVTVKGLFESDPDSTSVGAADAHANSEYYYFEGVFRGGVNVGGDHCTVRGRILAHNNSSGVAVRLAAPLGCNFDFSGCYIHAAQDAAVVGQGTIDCGGSATHMTADTTRGGVIDFSNVIIDAPTSNRVFNIRNRGCVTAEKVVIKLDGARIRETSGAGNLVHIGVVSGRQLDECHMHGFVQETDNAYGIAIDKIIGWRASGVVSIAGNTGAAFVTQAVTFPRRCPRSAPRVSLCAQQSAIGGKRVTLYAQSPSATGFTAGVLTVDGANFSTTASGPVAWIASVDE